MQGCPGRWLAGVILWALVPFENAEPSEFTSWFPAVEIEDYECRRDFKGQPIVNWPFLRQRLGDLVKSTLDDRSLLIREDAAAAAKREALQLEILEIAAVVLWRFPHALNECPFGAVTASIFATCMAYLDTSRLSASPLQAAYTKLLEHLKRDTLIELLSRDLSVLLDLAPLHVTAATEWNPFALLHIYLSEIKPHQMEEIPIDRLVCKGVSVAGYTSERMLDMIKRHTPYASGRDIEGLKFLRGLDGLVSATMKDPREFSTTYVPTCPAGAAAFGVSAAMLALMSNPSLFERFSNMAHGIMRSFTPEILRAAAVWGVFHGLAKMGMFALRSYDLVWSSAELCELPAEPHAFDALRLDPALRLTHLSANAGKHGHSLTRLVTSFLAQLKSVREDPEVMVYVTAVGGLPFANYITGFIKRALVVGLPALIVACMDQDAFAKCNQAVANAELDVYRESPKETTVLCVPAVEGHVIYIKHAFLPMLLSAAIDTVWIDFDTFILQEPSAQLRAARDAPARILPQRSRVRFGSFLFDNTTDLCSLSKICDPRQYWTYNLTSTTPESALDHQGVEVLVTEHWDARCLNNGLFYVRATYRTLVFFALFLRQIYVNPYTDNQNLFDAFLAHSTVDSAVPEARPILNYALLDIENKFGCAEGHVNEAPPGHEDGLATFHFWASDFRTREAAGEENSTAVRIVNRNGVERVAKVRAGKDDLFEIFFGPAAQAAYSKGVPEAGAAFIQQVRAPKPNWKGMCAVTAVGVEELVDERMLQGEQTLIDWQAATHVTETGPLEPVELSDPVSGATSACDRAPRCMDIPLEEWSSALKNVGELGSFLEEAEMSQLKARLRSLDVGVLLTARAFGSVGQQTLARELREVLRHPQTSAT
ncbi:clpX [Symbiodinium sp. CCMP2592]|nr:clpX [Symbiodinium sp. CCMP2592]